MTETSIDREELDPLPPSCKLVVVTLSYEGELTRYNLIKKTYLPKTTVRYALDRLLEEGMIERGHHAGDARERTYYLTSEANHE